MLSQHLTKLTTSDILIINILIILLINKYINNILILITGLNMSYSVQKINNNYHCFCMETDIELVFDDELFLVVSTRYNDGAYEFFTPDYNQVLECLELIESMGV